MKITKAKPKYTNRYVINLKFMVGDMDGTEYLELDFGSEEKFKAARKELLEAEALAEEHGLSTDGDNPFTGYIQESEYMQEWPVDKFNQYLYYTKLRSVSYHYYDEEGTKFNITF